MAELDDDLPLVFGEVGVGAHHAGVGEAKGPRGEAPSPVVAWPRVRVEIALFRGVELLSTATIMPKHKGTYRTMRSRILNDNK